MRAHLPDCESCRTLYDRHLLYGELTRRGLAAGGSPGPRAGLRSARGDTVLGAARAPVR